MIEIPLDNKPEQLFSIILNGERYDVQVMLNTRAGDGDGVWSISFFQSGVAVLVGLPLLAGVDIVHQFNIPIKNLYMINLDNTKLDPSRDEFGTGSKLFIVTDEEIESVTSV